MQKSLLLAFSLLAPVATLAQTQTLYPVFHPPVDSISGDISYQAVVQAPGASKQELYRRAREWFVNNFKGYREVVGVEDTLGGEITGTYQSIQSRYVLLTYAPYNCWRTLKIYVKNGRYRYELTNFGVSNARYGGIYQLNPNNKADMRRFGLLVDQQANRDIASLLTAMTVPSGISKKQDW